MNIVDVIPMILVFTCFTIMVGNLLFQYYMARRV